MDYEFKTTFWNDFSIADCFGISAILDTYKRAFSEWKDNVEYLTELVMVLNHKIWQWYKDNEPIAVVYDELWRESYAYGCETLKGEELSYFLEVLD